MGFTSMAQWSQCVEMILNSYAKNLMAKLILTSGRSQKIRLRWCPRRKSMAKPTPTDSGNLWKSKYYRNRTRRLNWIKAMFIWIVGLLLKVGLTLNWHGKCRLRITFTGNRKRKRNIKDTGAMKAGSTRDWSNRWISEIRSLAMKSSGRSTPD